MNTARFLWDELESVVAGEWLLPPSTSKAGVRGVIDDSRFVSAGALFVAVRGELADGHKYMVQAAQAGATAVCVERISEEQQTILAELGVACLRAGDGLVALQALARAHRRRFKDLVLVGITGSCGKTSTKEMIAAVLEQRWRGAVLKTEGNTNNHFGVPRNLLRLTNGHRAAVIEMGSNHPGEIALLAALAEPTLGVVSNIGHAHLEFFGDLAGVACEKGDILAGTASDGPVVLPTEAASLETLKEKAGARRVLCFGSGTESDIRVRYEGLGDDGAYGVRLQWRDSGEERLLHWSLGGAHQALNAGAAAAVGTALGIAPDSIVAGLSACRLPGMRMAIHELAGAHWVNDAYNANPDSMRAGVRWFAELTKRVPRSALVLVVGDMLELGHDGQDEHASLLSWLAGELPGATVVPVGSLMCAAACGAGLEGYADVEAAASRVAELAGEGSWVFLKGSRGIALESLIPAEPSR
ncbi:MAG: UDP-N-acetylmuramoyl-tripeptide--D-alanyl-D-alanine ligase [Lentisphaeria bacterium]|nr:UDP-N-acetylmuramoyl-tripeptide--D-alanyl-D-alanine ligase [Lentisphaeria bacterium]